MNSKIAHKAVEAVTLGAKGGYDVSPGMCERFARMVVQNAYPGQFAADLFAPTAKDTALALVHHGHAQAFDPHTMTLQPGDLIYKLYAPYGHAAVVVDADRIAENASTSIGRVNGALGYRTFEQWGTPDVIWRIPDDLGGRHVRL